MVLWIFLRKCSSQRIRALIVTNNTSEMAKTPSLMEEMGCINQGKFMLLIPCNDTYSFSWEEKRYGNKEVALMWRLDLFQSGNGNFVWNWLKFNMLTSLRHMQHAPEDQSRWDTIHTISNCMNCIKLHELCEHRLVKCSLNLLCLNWQALVMSLPWPLHLFEEDQAYLLQFTMV